MTTSAGSATASTRPRRVAPVPTLATIVVVALCVTAGVWQRDRMAQKMALRAAFDAVAAQPAVALPPTADWAAWRFRPVTVTGTFDAAHQILIDNKVRAGRAGFLVVAPLITADRRAVLVDRGWVSAGRSRAELPQVPPPGGIVTLTGRINLPPASYFELAPDSGAGPVWQNLDLTRAERAFGIALVPVIVEQTIPVGPGDELARDRPPPDFGINTHRMYMVQWFIFAALAGGLWAWFTFRRRR